MKKILSRKLFVSLGSIIMIVSSALQGSLVWAEAIPSIAAVAIGYCVAQGWVDAKEIEAAVSKADAPEEECCDDSSDCEEEECGEGES